MGKGSTSGKQGAFNPDTPNQFMGIRVHSSRQDAANIARNLAAIDVCKTPAAPSPIPIPYPNIGQSSDTSKGANKAVGLKKGSFFKKSTGDEAGTVSGFVSGLAGNAGRNFNEVLQLHSKLKRQ